jgi:hypothetical protein
MSKEMKPQTESDIALERAEAACLAGKAALSGKAKLPEGTTKAEFTLGQLTHALAQFKLALDLDRKGLNNQEEFKTIKEVIESQFPDEEDRRRFLDWLKWNLDG